jgi:hypothetical protein
MYYVPKKDQIIQSTRFWVEEDSIHWSSVWRSTDKREGIMWELVGLRGKFIYGYTLYTCIYMYVCISVLGFGWASCLLGRYWVTPQPNLSLVIFGRVSCFCPGFSLTVPHFCLPHGLYDKHVSPWPGYWIFFVLGWPWTQLSQSLLPQ